MSTYSILVIGLTLSFLSLVFDARHYSARVMRQGVYLLCEKYQSIEGVDNFSLYKKLPSPIVMAVSFKPLVLSEWFEMKELHTLNTMLDVVLENKI